ncbi:cbb3-type cytochrome c oxidase subunit 3 [Roseomonas eburnea]|uniref:Cbb3-type cytochrome c oxidase subunit 3 n=1 Tax=Neoroseomonas eburnea TaxID=1346889 RepID=A0A9X9XAA2_9PROT|nr:cbb3-type cytochrome c oxidase subunit 3 [Neoroseomonas eburnea]
MIDLLPLFRTLWVVWFFVLFLGMLWLVLRPSRKSHYEAQADIPLRDDPPARALRGDRPARALRGDAHASR